MRAGRVLLRHSLLASLDADQWVAFDECFIFLRTSAESEGCNLTRDFLAATAFVNALC